MARISKKHTPPVAVPLSVWSDLYAAAALFRELSPWKWMDDGELFGVTDPESSRTVYCCVMGALGEFFGLAAYRGAEGLKFHLGIQSGEIATDDPEIMMLQNCLMASFDDRRDMEPQDLAVIKALGLKFRGVASWPRFRDYSPGCLPWFLDEADARFLTIIIRQAAGVCERARENAGLLQPHKGGAIFTRVPKKGPEGIEWTDVWTEPASAEMPVARLPKIDDLRLQRIKKQSRQVDQIWEVTAWYLPMSIDDGKRRPFFPHALFVIDRESAFALGTDMAEPGRHAEAHLETMIRAFEQHRLLPSAMHVSRQEIAELLAPLAEKLGIPIKPVDFLAAAEFCRKSLIDHLMSR